MPTRLRRLAYTVQTDKVAGVDLAQIPVSGAPVRVYKQGATVSTTGPLSIATGTAVAVYDTGRLKATDTVALWRLNGSGIWTRITTGTATVASKVSQTSITLTIATGSLSVQRGDRLVPTSNRPTVYDEPSGTHAITASPTPLCDTTGRLIAFVAQPLVDVVVGDGVTGTPAISEVLDPDVPTDRIEGSPWVDASMYESIQDAINALPSGGTVFIPAGTWQITAAINIAVNDLRLLGEHHRTTIIKATTNNPTFHLLTVAGGVGGTQIECLTFDGRATGAANYDCIQIVNPGSAPQYNTIIDRCAFQNVQRNAIRAIGCFDTMVRDCAIFDTYGAGVFLDAVGSDNCTHFYMYNSEFSAIDLGHANVPAVKIDHSLGAQFMSCRFESCAGGTTAVSANGIHAKNSFGTVIQGCHFETGNNPPPTLIYQYICFEDSRGPSIIGCTIDGGGIGVLRPQYAIMGFGTTNLTWIGGWVDNIVQNFSHSDTSCRSWFIQEPDHGVNNVATAHSANVLTRSVRIEKQTVLLGQFADAADVTARAQIVKGAVVYRLDTNKSYTYDGTVWQAHW